MNELDTLFQKFPELRIQKFEEWFHSQLKSPSSEHPLKDAYLNGNYRLFEELTTVFPVLKDLQGFNNLMTNLKNPDQFFATVSEMQFNAYFKKSFTIELEPEIPHGEQHKKLDSKITIENRDVLFEIYTPKMVQKLSESGENRYALEIKNRMKNKLLDKLDEQIIPIKTTIHDTPLVVVVNASYSEMKRESIKEVLFGTQPYKVGRKKKGEFEAYSTPREENSLKNARTEANIISAILYYKKFRDYLIGKNSLEKKLILNPTAKNPLTKEECSILCRFDPTDIKR